MSKKWVQTHVASQQLNNQETVSVQRWVTCDQSYTHQATNDKSLVGLTSVLIDCQWTLNTCWPRVFGCLASCPVTDNFDWLAGLTDEACLFAAMSVVVVWVSEAAVHASTVLRLSFRLNDVSILPYNISQPLIMTTCCDSMSTKQMASLASLAHSTKVKHPQENRKKTARVHGVCLSKPGNVTDRFIQLKTCSRVFHLLNCCKLIN